MPADKDTKKVTERSTKQELWQAYNETRRLIEKEPVESGINIVRKETKDALRSLVESRYVIGEQFEKVSQEIIKDLDSLRELQSRIIKEKKGALDHFEEQKTALEGEIDAARRGWLKEKKEYELLLEAGKQALAKERQREEEDYAYKLSLARRNEEDEYNQKREQKEHELAERERVLKEREAEIVAMEKELAETPKKTEEEIKKAKEDLAKELVQRNETEKREFRLVAENEKRLAEMKITNLENAYQGQVKENESLRKQLGEVTAQLKQMAVSAIENRSGTPRPDNQGSNTVK